MSGATTLERISGVLSFLTEDERAEVDALLRAETPIWVPLPGPQTMAYDSRADIVYYGGSAGGGKSDLLLGLALNEHSHSIIYRRQTTQLIGIETRLLDEILQTRKGWNGQSDILTLPGNKIEFGSCNNAGDEIKYQGRPHDFCVAGGTPVLMGDNTWRRADKVIKGDMVMTLDGPCRVVKCVKKVDQGVRVDAIQNGQVIASQVQGVQHSLLMPSKSVCPGNGFGTLPPSIPCANFQMPLPFSDTFGHSSTQLQGKNTTPSGNSPRIETERQSALASHQTGRPGFSSSVGPISQETCCESFARQPLVSEQLVSGYDHSGHQQRPPESGEQGLCPQDAAHDRPGGLFPKGLEGCQGHCSPCSHLCDGHARPSQEVSPTILLLSTCAGLPIPNGSGDDGQGKTPIHTHQITSYVHPYSSETRQTSAHCSVVPFQTSPVGVIALYDFQVEGASHYITSGGFVNKNCGFDEITHFLESQFRFLCGWLRTTKEGQRTRIVCAGNPPTTTEGRWVIKFWAPWLDDKHPNPARPGELRWFTTVDGADIELPDGKPTEINGRVVTPISRTFIPSNITDNPFLLKTGYESTLQGLPEPLRSQMLLGDFKAGLEDSAWQIFPTAWVDAAMARWTPDGKKGQMDSIGADIARGGKDKTVAAPRYGTWYDELKSTPGSSTPNGATAAGYIISCMRDKAVAHVDALGVGGECIGHLETNGVQVVAVVGYDTESIKGQNDKATGKLRFRNLRALSHWRFRESLDPITGDNIALPPDPELRADLCSVMWKLTSGGILVEEKDEIKKRISRSPDKGDAVIYASMTTPKKTAFKRGQKNVTQSEEWDPY